MTTHAITPKTMILTGGPIDTRRNPTAVNKLAKEKGAFRFARFSRRASWPLDA